MKTVSYDYFSFSSFNPTIKLILDAQINSQYILNYCTWIYNGFIILKKLNQYYRTARTDLYHFSSSVIKFFVKSISISIYNTILEIVKSSCRKEQPNHSHSIAGSWGKYLRFRTKYRVVARSSLIRKLLYVLHFVAKSSKNNDSIR